LRAKLGIFLRRHVDHDQTIYTGSDRIFQEAIHAVDIYGVVIAH